ncbi:MAG: 50S ribosomal protein L24 [Chlamydiota bacterium]|nr:50S ribosomal protein L24 [Chlamydiota bacterium]
MPNRNFRTSVKRDRLAKKQAETKRKHRELRSKKIRKGDTVIAIAGNYKGQTGTVLSVDSDKAVVQGLNVRKKHVKKSEQMPNGGIISVEKPLHISNLKVCVDGDKAVKLKVKAGNDGERELYYVDGDKEVTYRSLKKHNP